MLLDDTVTFLHGFHHLDTAPRSLDGSFCVKMCARHLVPCICTRLAQCKHQLVLTVMRQHRVEKTMQWQYRTFDQSEIIGNVFVKILGDDLRMADRYSLRSVDVGIKAGKVNVPDLFVSLVTMVQFGCIGPTTVQGMMRVSRIDHVKMLEKMLHLFVLLQFSVDVTFPHFHHIIAVTSQVLALCQGAMMKFLHGFVIGWIHGIAGVTFMPSGL